MKKTLTYFLLFSILISYGNMEIQSQSNDRLIVEHDSKSDKPIKDLRFNYEERDRIEIYDDGDLASESSEGDGSEEFPYVIEGWRIETGGNYPGILIRYVTKSFVVRNCWIEGNQGGIIVEYVTTMTINITNNVVINNSGEGIFIGESTDITVIVNDNICNFNRDGICIYDSLDVEVRNNTCNNNGHTGIYLVQTLTVLIQNNTCNYNQVNGIFAFDSDWYSSYSENICIGNGVYGLYLEMIGTHCDICDNHCYENNLEGIHLEATRYNLLSGNIFINNTNYGLDLDTGAENNDIHHNYFYFNNLGGSSQAYDDCSGNTWYDTVTSEGNYWKNWYNGAYPIDGTAGEYDLYPLDLDPPEIDVVADIEYVHGEMGHVIQWNVSDLNPTIFFVYKNFIEILSGSWTNDIPIVVLVDGLEAGTYYYQLFILDSLNRSSLDTVIVTVAAGISEFSSIAIISLLIIPIIASTYFYKKNKKVNNN